MTTYKNKNQKANNETSAVLFLQTNKPVNAKFWDVCSESEISGDYLGSSTYTENGVSITEKTWGKL